MFFVIASAFLATIFASGYKVATLVKADRVVVTTFIQLSALGIVCSIGLIRGSLHLNPTVVFIGVFSGVNMYLCMAAFFAVMRYGRLAVQWTVINMAVAVPVAASLLLWGERPTPWHVTGMVLAALAMLLLGVDKGKSADKDAGGDWYNPERGRWARASWLGLVLVAFLCTGFSQACNKALLYYGQAYYKTAYLFVMLATASLMGLGHMGLRRTRPALRDVGLGFAMSSLNLLVLWLLLLGLEAMPAIVFFPLRSIFGIVFTTAMSLTIWRESIRAPGVAGLIVAAAAILCLSL